MNNNIKYVLVLHSLLFALVACQKTELAPSSTLLAEKNQQPGSMTMAGTSCLVTHTEDNIYGYTLDIFYNKFGNPDSMSFYGSLPVKMFYDSKQRLTRVNFDVYGVRYDFIYKSGSDLPISINFYYPYYASQVPNGLIAVFRLNYNSKGQINKITTNNLLNPQYGSFETYDYNTTGNVTKVTSANLTGTSSYIPNEARLYDDKPNFMGGNKWLKYILYNSSVDVYYYFRMFSKNNALEFTKDFGDGFIFPFFAEYQYNNSGFANEAVLHLVYDETYSEDYFESSTSTCDVSPFKSRSQLNSSSSKTSPRMSLTNSQKLPLTIKAR